MDENLAFTLRLNMEGHWPRSAYAQYCADQRIEYTEAGYLRWRDVGERLSGAPSFETTVKRASAALQQMGMSMAAAGDVFANAARMVERREEERIRERRAGGGGAAGPEAQPAVLRG